MNSAGMLRPTQPFPQPLPGPQSGHGGSSAAVSPPPPPPPMLLLLLLLLVAVVVLLLTPCCSCRQSVRVGMRHLHSNHRGGGRPICKLWSSCKSSDNMVLWRVLWRVPWRVLWVTAMVGGRLAVCDTAE